MLYAFTPNRSTCSACHASDWNTASSCEVCGNPLCDQCPGAEVVGFNTLVCSGCMVDAIAVFDKIRPQLFDSLLDVLEDQPLSLEVFRRVVECDSVSQIKAVFATPCVPIRKPAGAQGTGQRRAA